MIQYSNLTNSVVSFLEISSSDLDKFQVVENLNLAQRELVNILPQEYVSNVIKTSVFDLVVNQAHYQFPGDFSRFISLNLDYVNSITDANTGRLAHESKRHMISNAENLGTKMYPLVFLSTEKGYQISPIPVSNVASGGRLTYVYHPPDISATQDSMLDIRLENLLVYKAVSVSALVDNYRPDLSNAFLNMYKDLMKEILPVKKI